MPTASAAASALWKSPLPSSAERWQRLREQHPELQRRAGVASGDAAKLARLSLLDADFVKSDLPQKLLRRGGNDAPLTKADLLLAVEWKLLRGKWRPALLGYARDQTDAAVGAAATKALSALRGGGASASSSSSSAPSDAQTRAALDALCALRGVGPATASIFLCAATAGEVPYMSDEALEACVGSRRYTADELLALAARLRAKARELTEAGAAVVWTAEDVQRALHAAELEARVPAAATTKGAAAAGGKEAEKKKKKSDEAGSRKSAAAASAPPKRQRRR